MPPRIARRDASFSARPTPMGERTPIPVTTTRRMPLIGCFDVAALVLLLPGGSARRSLGRCRGAFGDACVRLLDLREDEVDQLVDGADLPRVRRIGPPARHLAQLREDVDRVDAVEVELFVEGRGR